MQWPVPDDFFVVANSGHEEVRQPFLACIAQVLPDRCASIIEKKNRGLHTMDPQFQEEEVLDVGLGAESIVTCK